MIADGYDTMAYSQSSLEDMVTSLEKKNFKQIDASLKKGTTALHKNVKFGEKTTKNVVKPEDVAKNFANSAKFVAELSTVYK